MRSASGSTRSIARRRSRRSRAPRRARKCSAESCATARAPNGRCRASSAARRRWRPSVLERAHALGLVAHGLSFHVGSQQRNPRMWDRALKVSAAIFRDLAERGIQLAMLNLGGGFPTRYLQARAAGPRLRADDLPRAAPPFRQPHSGDDHRAGPRHGRQRRDHRGGGGADLAQVGGGPRCAGSISTSASSTASPRRWTR